jgi:hypothetical protein
MLRLCNCLRALLRIRRSADLVFGILNVQKAAKFRQMPPNVNRKRGEFSASVFTFRQFVCFVM